MRLNEVVERVREMVGYPAPESGGTDYFANAQIQRLINMSLRKLLDQIHGLPAQLEFEIDDTGALTVTKPTSGAPAVTEEQEGGYKIHRVQDMRAYLQFQNLTSGVSDNSRRIMEIMSPFNPKNQFLLNATQEYCYYYFIRGKNGLMVLPDTPSTTNTILLDYKKTHTWLADSTVGDATFTSGGGPSVGDDITTGGTFTGESDIDYVVEIDFAGTPDTLKWSDDGGVTWDATGVAITAGAITLNNGVTVSFGVTTGHVVGDSWAFTAVANETIDSFLDDEDILGYPVTWPTYMLTLQIRDLDSNKFLQQTMVELREFKVKHWNYDLTPGISLKNPRRTSGRII